MEGSKKGVGKNKGHMLSGEWLEEGERAVMCITEGPKVKN